MPDDNETPNDRITSLLGDAVYHYRHGNTGQALGALEEIERIGLTHASPENKTHYGNILKYIIFELKNMKRFYEAEYQRVEGGEITNGLTLDQITLRMSQLDVLIRVAEHLLVLLQNIPGYQMGD